MTTGSSLAATYFGYDKFKFPILKHPNKLQKIIDVQQLQRSVDNHNMLTIFLVLTVVTCFLVTLRLWYSRSTVNILLVLPMVVTVAAVLFILVMLHSISFLPKVFVPPTGFQYENSAMPSVFISSLRWSGSEIVGELFAKSDDFVYAQVSDLNIPTMFSKQFINFCIWRNMSDQNGLIVNWLYDHLTKPDLIIEEMKYDWRTHAGVYHRFIDQSYSHRRVALGGTNGNWNLKLPWIQSVIGDGARPQIVGSSCFD